MTRPVPLQPYRPWGTSSRYLRFALFNARVCGLSHSQAVQLTKQFQPFVGDDLPDPASLTICAGLHPNLPAPSPGRHYRDGAYKPTVEWRDQCLCIAGDEFEARVNLDVAPPQLDIAVADEQAFATIDVLENCLRILSAYMALARGGLVMHSAGLVIDGRSWLFIGRSNAGKTTLSRKAHAAGHRVLSDDLNLVLPRAQGFDAHRVPFTGEFGRTLSDQGLSPSYPLSAIGVLTQKDGLTFEPMPRSSALASLLACSPFANDDERVWDDLTDVLDALMGHVPVFCLGSARSTPFNDIHAGISQFSPTLEAAS